MVDLDAVSLRLGRVDILHGINLHIPSGILCGLLAPSGGGKTSVLRLITGLYAPTRGTVRVFGAPPHRFSAGERRRLGYMPQQFVLYPELSVRRNLEFMARLYALSPKQRSLRISELLAMTGLEAARDRRAGRLSGGMQRRLQLAATLLHEPELMVIDEPTAGIDPILRARFWDHFRALRDGGKTLVISTQYVTEAEYCDEVVIMTGGRVVAHGAPDALRRLARTPEERREGIEPNFETVFLRLTAAGAIAEGV